MSGDGHMGTSRPDYTLAVPAELKARIQRLRDHAGYPKSLAPLALRLLERGILLEEQAVGLDKPA